MAAMHAQKFKNWLMKLLPGYEDQIVKSNSEQHVNVNC